MASVANVACIPCIGFSPRTLFGLLLGYFVFLGSVLFACVSSNFCGFRQDLQKTQRIAP
jgi:hypothetical protein